MFLGIRFQVLLYQLSTAFALTTETAEYDTDQRY